MVSFKITKNRKGELCAKYNTKRQVMHLLAPDEYFAEFDIPIEDPEGMLSIGIWFFPKKMASSFIRHIQPKSPYDCTVLEKLSSVLIVVEYDDINIRYANDGYYFPSSKYYANTQYLEN